MIIISEVLNLGYKDFKRSSLIKIATRSLLLVLLKKLHCQHKTSSFMSKPCLICQSNIEAFHSFGRMPIANGFLKTEQFGGEYFFELKVAWCEICHMFQLTDLVDREKMFHENYAFFSSTSKLMG